MPIYEYECPTCGLHFERRQSFQDTALPLCPNGHTGVHRIFNVPAIVFKGSGWAINDSRTSISTAGSE